MVLLQTSPSALAKVVELSRAIVEAASKPAGLLRWLEYVVRSQDETLHEWALKPAQDGERTFYELVQWALPQTQNKNDPATRYTAERCLLIGMNVLFAGRRLSPMGTLRVLN